MKKTIRKASLPGGSPQERLRLAGIRHFDVPIHEQDKDWLIENFPPGRYRPKNPVELLELGKYLVNVARLMRNLVWQLRERVKADGVPFHELIRTFWYMYVKPTLAHADSLSEDTDQYKQLSENLAKMVKYYRLMAYKDIGFRDDNEVNRKVGAFANIIPFAEKVGHFDYLTDLQKKHKVSIIALGGQPSVMNVEYFVDDIKKSVNLKRSFYLYGIVDFDPAGWDIREAFLEDLAHYGIKNTRVHDLIDPDILEPEQVLRSRYPLDIKEEKENRRWFEEVSKRQYANLKYLVEKQDDGKLKLYGLECEAVSTDKLDAKLKKIMEPIIGGDEHRLKLIEMKDLNEAVKELIVFKVTHPAPPDLLMVLRHRAKGERPRPEVP